MFSCASKGKKAQESQRSRSHSSFRLSKEEQKALLEGAAELERRAPGLQPEPEPEPEHARGAGPGGRREAQSSPVSGGKDPGRPRQARVRTSVLPPWTRQKLSSDWTEEKAVYLGQVGKVVSVDLIGKQIELSFGESRELRKLIYPIGAVGLRKKDARDTQEPLDDAFVLLSVAGGGGAETQRWCEDNRLEVQVRSDPKFVEECFVHQTKPFLEVAETDWHAMVSCGVAFFGAFTAGWLTDSLGLGSLVQLLVALPLWMVVAYNAIYLERRRVRRIELLSEREAKTRRERTVIPDDENVEWLNAVLRKVWGPLEPRVSKTVQWTAQAAVADMVMEPYVPEINIPHFSLGQQPPSVQYASYEPSDVYGEFKVNMQLMMVAPEMSVDTLVTVCIGGLELEVPVRATSVIVELDMQLVVRMSEEQGLTMLGIMMNKPLELDYCLKAFGLFKLSSIPMVCGYLNNAINDSLWWMRKPEILELPWVPSADLDTELSRPTRNIGLLEITILQACNLKQGLAQKLDPYVKVSLRSKKDHKMVMRKSGSDDEPRFQEKTGIFQPGPNDLPENPAWGHEMHTYLKANECGNDEHNAVLCFQVFDADTGSDRQIGEVTVDLWDLITTPAFVHGKTQWLPLMKSRAYAVDASSGAEVGSNATKEPQASPVGSGKGLQSTSSNPELGGDKVMKNRGSLRVRMQWHKKMLAKALPMVDDPLETKPKDVHIGILEVTVKGCRRLTATSGNKDDPYVSIDVGGKNQLRTSAVTQSTYPSFDDGPFDFSINDMAKVIRIQVNDARKQHCIGSVLRKKHRHHADFPSMSEFLSIVNLIKGGKIRLMEKADVWLPLNDPKTGKVTDQELHLQVAFRACGEYHPRCDAVLVTKIPMPWALQPANSEDQRSHKFRQTLEMAFYGNLLPESLEAPGTHMARCPGCDQRYPCEAGRVRHVYCPALQINISEADSNGKTDEGMTTWALVVLQSHDDAAGFVKSRHFGNDDFLRDAANHAGTSRSVVTSVVEMEAFDPTPRHDDRFRAPLGLDSDEDKVPLLLPELPLNMLHPATVQGGMKEPDFRQRARGADGFLSKPITEGDLEQGWDQLKTIVKAEPGKQQPPRSPGSPDGSSTPRRVSASHSLGNDEYEITPEAFEDWWHELQQQQYRQQFHEFWKSYVSEQRPDGLLIVRVSNCEGLMWADKGNKSSDPYVVLTTQKWTTSGSAEITQQYRTKTVKANLNPHYDETFAFKMPRHCCVDELHIEVFDWNQLSKSTSLGETTLDLRSVFDDGWHVASRGQYPLQRSANSPPKSSTKKMSFRRSSSTQSNESEDDPEDRGGPGEVGLRLKFVPDLPLSLDSD